MSSSVTVLSTSASWQDDQEADSRVRAAGESAAVDTGAGGAGLFGGDRTGGAHGMHEAVDNEEDEFLDRADRFEHAYNFRCARACIFNLQQSCVSVIKRGCKVYV